MHLLSLLISFLIILFSWTKWSNNRINFDEILRIIHYSLNETLVTQLISTASLIFFLESFLKSKTIESIIKKKKRWIKGNPKKTIFAISSITYLLSSSFSWFDEFIFFYPLAQNIFAEAGLKSEIIVLSIYGSSVIGLVNLISNWRMKKYIEQCYGIRNFQGNYQNKLRRFLFFLFSLFLIFFSKKIKQREEILQIQETEDEREGSLKNREIISLSIFICWIIFSNIFQKILNKKNEYFDSFFLLGGILICLVNKLQIIKNLELAFKDSISILTPYFFGLIPLEFFKTQFGDKEIKNKFLQKRKNGLIFNFFGSYLLSFLLNSTSVMAELSYMIRIDDD